MTKDEALDLALELRELADRFSEGWHDGIKIDASDIMLLSMAASQIEQARSAPVQEPVAGQPLPCPFCGHIGLDFSDGETYRWGVASCGGCGASCGDVRREYPDKSEWHTEAIAEWNRRSTAPQRQWVGLTDEEIIKATQNIAGRKNIAQAIEAKLKEKNGWYRQHVTDGSPCWCEPEISYTNPETGASVIVHKEPQ